jgi:hypothetical protein
MPTFESALRASSFFLFTAKRIRLADGLRTAAFFLRKTAPLHDTFGFLT